MNNTKLTGKIRFRQMKVGSFWNKKIVFVLQVEELVKKRIPLGFYCVKSEELIFRDATCDDIIFAKLDSIGNNENSQFNTIFSNNKFSDDYQ